MDEIRRSKNIILFIDELHTIVGAGSAEDALDASNIIKPAVIGSTKSRTLRGWYGYFKHSKANVFEPIDGYTRGRLRSILRKRMRKKGRGRGKDHQRWPNA